eukprot:891383-Prorocentrum_minimum.AAC.1
MSPRPSPTSSACALSPGRRALWCTSPPTPPSPTRSPYPSSLPPRPFPALRALTWPHCSPGTGAR